MNEETNETRTTIYRPAPSGRGSAIRFTLHPAHGNVSGCVMCELARQRTAVSVTGETPTSATFDWDNAIAMKLCVSDLAQMLMDEHYGLPHGRFYVCRWCVDRSTAKPTFYKDAVCVCNQ